MTKTWNREESAGAKVSLEVAPEEFRSGAPGLKLHGDFTGGGKMSPKTVDHCATISLETNRLIPSGG